MQFLISVIDSTTGGATEAEMAAIGAFNEQLRADGNWVIACGITAPAEAAVIDNRGGTGSLVDGPLIESTEYLAGFWIVSAADVDAARELAMRASQACNRRVELRPLLG